MFDNFLYAMVLESEVARTVKAITGPPSFSCDDLMVSSVSLRFPMPCRMRGPELRLLFTKTFEIGIMLSSGGIIGSSVSLSLACPTRSTSIMILKRTMLLHRT